MRKQRVMDWSRRALIVLLLISAALLLRQTGYFAGFRKRLQLSAAEQTEGAALDQSQTRSAAVTVQPTAVMVCASDGALRYGAAWEEATTAVLRRFSADLGEALGSAGAPEKISEEAFRERLERCGVFLQFYCPQPLELLSEWLGAEMSGGAAALSAQSLCLSASGTEVSLSFVTPEKEFCSCATAVSADGFRNRAAEFAPNGAYYAWESERLGGGYSVLLPTPPTAALAKSTVPLLGGEMADVLLQTMDMNRYVASSYVEADGTTVYVDEETTLRVNPSGTAFFRRAAGPGTDDAGSFARSVGSAWQIAERSVGRACGDGALMFAGASYNAPQRTTTVYFDYHVNGIPVRLTKDHAAEIVMRGDTVIQAELQFRSFAVSGDRTELLPFLQAAAIAEAGQGRPELVYADSGETTECVWVIADE